MTRNALVLLFLLSCGDDDRHAHHNHDGSKCRHGEDILMTLVAASQPSPVTGDLDVHGSLRVPDDVTVYDVLLGVELATADGDPPQPSLAAKSDDHDFTIWSAKIPITVLLAPLSTPAGEVHIVAMPDLNCEVDTTEDPRSISVSGPIEVSVPPDAGSDVDAGS